MPKKIKILIVEDDPEWRNALERMYRDILGERRVEIHHASTVSEGQQKLNKQPVDLLSLDVNLASASTADGGSQNGYDLLQEACDKKQVRAIILVTGVTDDPKVPPMRSGSATVKQAKINPCYPVPERYKKSCELLRKSNDAISDQIHCFKTMGLGKRLKKLIEQGPKMRRRSTSSVTLDYQLVKNQLGSFTLKRRRSRRGRFGEPIVLEIERYVQLLEELIKCGQRVMTFKEVARCCPVQNVRRLHKPASPSPESEAGGRGKKDPLRERWMTSIRANLKREINRLRGDNDDDIDCLIVTESDGIRLFERVNVPDTP